MRLDFSQIEILVVGDIMLDEYKIGDAHRLSQEAPVPVVLLNEEIYCLGGAANVAANLKDLGCKICIVGAIGNDYSGDIVIDQMSKRDIDCGTLIRDKYLLTITKTRIISDDQHLVRYDKEKRIVLEGAIIEKISELNTQPDAVIISDYNKGTITGEVIDHIKRRFNCRIFADIKPEVASIYSGIYCITPNYNESIRIANVKSEKVEDISRAIKSRLSLDCIVVTMSAQGVYLIDDNDKCYMIGCHEVSKERRHRRDVTGAGDTFISILVAAITSGSSFVKAAEFANIGSGIVVNKLGTSTCYLHEINKEIKHA